MSQGEFEAWLDFRAGENPSVEIYQCCECGGDSDAYAEITETGEWLCKECFEKSEETNGDPESQRLAESERS